jgi:hypothetical protein
MGSHFHYTQFPRKIIISSALSHFDSLLKLILNVFGRQSKTYKRLLLAEIVTVVVNYAGTIRRVSFVATFIYVFVVTAMIKRVIRFFENYDTLSMKIVSSVSMVKYLSLLLTEQMV